MLNCDHIQVVEHIQEDQTVKVLICDSFLQCECCTLFIEELRRITIDQIISELSEIPTEVTKIHIPIYPIPTNLEYYTINGIKEIVHNLFESVIDKHNNELDSIKSYLKIYFEPHSLFNIPVLQIEIIMLSSLSPELKDELLKTMKAEVLVYTSTIGKLEEIKISIYEELEEILYIPLLKGFPEFKLEGVFAENSFTKNKIEEINQILTFPIELIK